MTIDPTMTENDAALIGLKQRLALAMTARKLKAAQLARRANLNASAVRDIMHDRSRNPGMLTLAQIAGVLDVSPGWLAYGEPGQSLFALCDIEEAISFPTRADARAVCEQLGTDLQWLDMRRALMPMIREFVHPDGGSIWRIEIIAPVTNYRVGYVGFSVSVSLADAADLESLA